MQPTELVDPAAAHPAAAHPAAAPAAAAPAYTALVVDDEVPIRRAVRHALLDGHPAVVARVVEAGTAAAALAHAAAERPALVVLDLGLPDADGATVCRELRARLVDARTEGRQFGLLGEPRVNVLLLNIAADSAFPLRSGARAGAPAAGSSR